MPEIINEFTLSANGTVVNHSYWLYEYNTAKQLVKKSLLGPNHPVACSVTQYSYPAAGQIKEEVYSCDMTGNMRLISTTVKQFDNKKNPYMLLNFYQGITSLSKNNVIAHYETNHNTGRKYNYTYSYEYNEDDFPVKVTFVSQGNNFPSYYYWTYNCQ
ncbi:hypothetical protein I5M27_09420 [Adhaeribacter sp. BT258]|uniref:YD repeat-containing protein n=1 Tax=Adhaeribacter terrigena TaxID=2793070 RepID=A0ABS1C1C4_9BACT|nr:hypothetical protein [Adhaeribacter terrigena]MBK0403204.1 hypothetical protein [Adhaeribacter terrigena]